MTLYEADFAIKLLAFVVVAVHSMWFFGRVAGAPKDAPAISFMPTARNWAALTFTAFLLWIAPSLLGVTLGVCLIVISIIKLWSLDKGLEAIAGDIGGREQKLLALDEDLKAKRLEMAQLDQEISRLKMTEAQLDADIELVKQIRDRK